MIENFIIQHLGGIIAVLILLIIAAVLCFAAKGKYRKIAKRILLFLVVSAEKKYGGKTGEIKFAAVADALHDRMPGIVQFLFTENDIANMIEEAVTEMKRILAENPEASLTITGKGNE